MKTYCRRMDISDENFIRKYIAAFIYDKLENGNMPSIFAYYGSISKNEARRRLENSPEFVASVIDQIAYEMSWHLKTRTVTAIEFLSGYILNIVLGLGIWDYSNMPFNIIGQICLPFTVAWYILSLLAIVLDDHLRYWIFGEEKPRYKWR